MKRIYAFIMCMVLLALAAGTSAAGAQWQAQGMAAAETVFDRLFLQDPLANNAWGNSHTVIDASGGVHTTFYNYDYIYYAHCPADCGDPNNWLVLPLYEVGIFDSLDEPTLMVDSNNRPRLMWYTAYNWGEDAYYYAECNSGCANNSANWDSTLVANVDAYSYPHDEGYAALDDQDQPHLVYPQTNYPDYGFHYYTCESECTGVSNWYSTTITTPGLEPDILQLVFDPDGRPRVMGYARDTDSLFYAQCNNNCATAAGWGSVGLLAPIYEWGDFTLQVNAAGYPRVAYYTGDADDNALYYAWSNNLPLTAAYWSSYTLNYPSGESWTLDMRLDNQDRPRVAFETEDLDLSYLTCTAGCNTANPTWQQQVIETGDDLEADYPIAKIPTCLSATWMVTGYPSLALDAAGNPSFSYMTRHGQLCYNQQGQLQILYDAESIRFATAGSGGQSGRQIYLPLITK